jgi:ABC-type amino acid transport substrate-binding protein
VEDGGGGGGGGGQAAEQQPSAEVRDFPADSPLGRIQEAGRITIGVKYDVPPFGFRNPQTGDVEGFDVELGRAIAADLGVEPRFIEAVSDNRIPFLQDRTADLIISTMTINQERDQEIDFSTPYYVARGRILVPQDSQIQGVEGLSGQRVCTALGSTYEETIREQAPRADLRLVDSYSECLELVQNGAVDAVSTDDVILTGMIIQDDSLKLVGEQLTTEPYGVGIRQGATEMKEFVDGVIDRYKQDGRWARSYQRWIGQYTQEEQSPPDLTLEQALEMSG